MKKLLTTLTLLAALPAGAALADDDCNVPRDAWQPNSAVLQKAADQGWKVDEIEVDDGCYEVKATDQEGRRIKAKLDPATLEVVKLKHKDGDKGERRGPVAAPMSPTPATPPANPLLQNGTRPVVRAN